MTSAPHSSPAPATPRWRRVAGEIVVHVCGRTDVGRMREHNEDSFLIGDLSKESWESHPEPQTFATSDRGTLFIVADGLGGAAAGEIASQLAAETVFNEMRRNWSTTPDTAPERFATALKNATETANAKIHAYALDHPEHKGMGTTATIAGLLHDTLYLVQVGDSRAYLVRDGKMQQITKDQSLMQRLIDAGEMTAEEAERSERRNIILQALGPEPTIRADLTHQEVRHGDALILCTDGLFGQVRKDEMEQLIGIEPNLVTLCTELIARANENGGPDNITVVAARFAGRRLEVAADSDRIGHEVFPLPGMELPTFSLDFTPSPVTGHTSMQAAVADEAPAPGTKRLLRILIAVFVTLAVALGIAIAATQARSRANATAPSMRTTDPPVRTTGAR